jgi:hypothetical protein
MEFYFVQHPIVTIDIDVSKDVESELPFWTIVTVGPGDAAP